MPSVVSCKFRGSYKVYYFAPGDLPELFENDQVIVETSRGREMAQVVSPKLEIENSDIVGELKPIVRRAGPADLLEAQTYQHREKEAVDRCKEQVAKTNLPMKIVSAEYNFDGSNLTFYFTSEQRVDFRDLVRDLARIFRTRIELRQVGVRDEAKVIGGVGKCGRPLCCATWLPEFYPVSIRMAKLQDLPLSPMEISGCCGRLLCCLGYENEQYAEIKSHFPKVGKIVQLACGPSKVVKVDALREMATVQLEDGTIRILTADQLSGDAPLECEPDDDALEEQHDALNGVLSTLGEKALQSLGSTAEATEVRPPMNAAASQPGSPDRREPRQNSQPMQRRQPPTDRNQRRTQPTAHPAQVQPVKLQPVEQSKSENAVETEAPRKRRRRGGRHHPRRDRQTVSESASGGDNVQASGS
ncbi:MAG: PSP1 domain-containing protein [Anaerolineae bacterium]